LVSIGHDIDFCEGAVFQIVAAGPRGLGWGQFEDSLKWKASSPEQVNRAHQSIAELKNDLCTTRPSFYTDSTAYEAIKVKCDDGTSVKVNVLELDADALSDLEVISAAFRSTFKWFTSIPEKELCRT